MCDMCDNEVSYKYNVNNLNCFRNSTENVKKL